MSYHKRRNRLRKIKSRLNFIDRPAQPQKQRNWLKIAGQSRHHWLNKTNFGQWSRQNISYLKIAKHNFWHQLFQNLSLEQTIDFLKLSDYDLTRNYRWKEIFKKMNIPEAIALLERTKQIKDQQSRKGLGKK